MFRRVPAFRPDNLFACFYFQIESGLFSFFIKPSFSAIESSLSFSTPIRDTSEVKQKQV